MDGGTSHPTERADSRGGFAGARQDQGPAAENGRSPDRGGPAARIESMAPARDPATAGRMSAPPSTEFHFGGGSFCSTSVASMFMWF